MEKVLNKPSIFILSKQRVVGKTNGSSVYLLSIVESLRERGFDVHYICPSPNVFGRWPVLRMKKEMQEFTSMHIRGSFKFGKLFFSKNPLVTLNAAKTLLIKMLQKIGFKNLSDPLPAPYSIGSDWKVEDFDYIKKKVAGNCIGVIADYVFLVKGFEGLTDDSIPKAVIMHDLFSERNRQFLSKGNSEHLSNISIEDETQLLSKADIIVSIQSKEASIVKKFLPNKKVIVAPMAISVSKKPSPGRRNMIMFVGSSAKPNVLGLEWFTNFVWPKILKVEPEAELFVIGSVNSALRKTFPRTHFWGIVDNHLLKSAYQQSGIIIAPLIIGSGLKVKLIEALGHGKCIVGTSIAIEGVEKETEGALVVADEAEKFAESVIECMRSDALREQYGKKAITAAEKNFSPQACYSELVEFFQKEILSS